MSWMQVVGGPLPPSDRGLTAVAPLSSLTVTLLDVYQDGTRNFPLIHQAEFDATNNRWKPKGSPDGTLWYLPGQLTPSEPAPPYCRFVEVLYFTDDSTARKAWKQRVTSGSTTWGYGTPG